MKLSEVPVGAEFTLILRMKKDAAGTSRPVNGTHYNIPERILDDEVKITSLGWRDLEVTNVSLVWEDRAIYQRPDNGETRVYLDGKTYTMYGSLMYRGNELDRVYADHVRIGKVDENWRPRD